MPSPPQRVVVGLLILLAAVVRFTGITHAVDSDEGKLVNPAATMRVKGVHRALYPGGARYPHATYYFLGGTFWITGRVLLQHDAWDRTVVARVVLATLSTLSVALVVALGRRFGGWPVGFLSGLFLAVFPVAVKYAHYAHVDTPAAFWMLAAVYGAMRIWETGAPRWYGATGVATGLAFATQFYGLVVTAAYVLGHLGWTFLHAPRWRALRRPAFFIGLLLIPLVFTLASPWRVFAWKESLASYRGLALRARGGDLGYTSPHLLWPLTTHSPDWGIPFTVSGLVWETPWPVFALAALGLVAAARRRDWRFFVIVGGSLLVFYLAIAGYVRMHAIKRLLSLAPLLSLAAAYGVARAGALFPRAPGLARAVTVLLATGGTASALWMIGGFDLAYARSATLPAAVAWAETSLPEGSTVLQHGPLMLLDPSRTSHRVLTLREEYANIGGRQDRRVADHRARPLAEWLSENVDFVVLDWRMVGRYYEPTAMRMYPEMTASYRAFYDEIRARGTRAYEIAPAPWRRAGPRIEIYDVRALRSGASHF